MFQKFKLPFLFFIAISIGTGLAEEEQVSLQFVTFPKWTERQPIQLAVGDGKVLELTVPSNSFSQPYQVPALSNWVFGRPTTDEDGKPGFEVFGQAESLGPKSQLIVLIRLGKTPADGLKVIALGNRLSEFGGGDFFYLNASNFDVAGMMGRTRFVIKPGKHDLVKLAPGDLLRKEGIPFVHTVLFYRDSDQSDPFFSSTWPANPKARSMVFFYHSGANHRIRMHTIQSFLP